jgi:hypothetical protein
MGLPSFFMVTIGMPVMPSLQPPSGKSADSSAPGNISGRRFRRIRLPGWMAGASFFELALFAKQWLNSMGFMDVYGRYFTRKTGFHGFF